MPDLTDVLQIMTGVRSRLGHPPVSKLRNVDILVAIRHALGAYRTWLKIVDQNYYYQVGEFAIAPGQANFPVSIGNIKKPLVCEWVNPLYPTDTGVEIKIVNFQDLDKITVAPLTTYNPWDTTTVEFQDMARAISFVGMPPTFTCRIVPTPRYQATYRLHYQPLPTQIIQVDESLEFHPEHFTLIEVAASLRCLPQCGYSRDDRDGYSQQLAAELRTLEANFRHDTMQNKQQSVTSSRGYVPGGSGYGNTGGWGGGYL